MRTSSLAGAPSTPQLRWLFISVFVLAVLSLASLTIGSRNIPIDQTFLALFDPDPQNDLHLIVRQLRVPRTLLAALAGGALGLAGALMQAITRNPMVEPGLLGINGGAALAVVLGVAIFDLADITHYIWFGFLGAGIVGTLVFLLGRAHLSGTDPLRLLLAGAGLTVVLGAATSLIILNSDPLVFDTFRNWSAGSLEGRGMGVAGTLTIAAAMGGIIAFSQARSLNSLALGHELGQTLGVRPAIVWTLCCVAVMCLAGGATAAAGPIAFVGLVAAHLARAAGGVDYRWILPLSAIFAASLLVFADIIGRVVAAPMEIAAGIVASVIGGPFFIYVARNFRLANL